MDGHLLKEKLYMMKMYEHRGKLGGQQRPLF